LDHFRELASHSKVKAIGEIGLDYYRDRTPRNLQCAVFEKQLDLAVELNLPVIIHIRDDDARNRPAMRDLLRMLSAWDVGFKASDVNICRGVLHSFSGEVDAALQAVDKKFLLGISGPVTYNNATELRKVVAQVSLHDLVIETDAPFLAPHPHRGKRNEPAFVRHIAERIAIERNVEFEIVAQATTENAKRLFRW
jgi:TatD DNase family protein